MCPECEEPVVGVKEQEDLDAESIEVEDSIFLTKPSVKSRDQR